MILPFTFNDDKTVALFEVKSFLFSCCCWRLLFEAGVRRCCLKQLLFEATVGRSCGSKLLLLEEAAVGSNYNINSSCCSKLLFEAADCSCFSNLMFEAAVGSCGSKLLRFEAALFGSSCCFEQLLLESTATAATVGRSCCSVVRSSRCLQLMFEAAVESDVRC